MSNGTRRFGSSVRFDYQCGRDATIFLATINRLNLPWQFLLICAVAAIYCEIPYSVVLFLPVANSNYGFSSH
jgi:hypothetical protein